MQRKRMQETWPPTSCDLQVLLRCDGACAWHNMRGGKGWLGEGGEAGGIGALVEVGLAHIHAPHDLDLHGGPLLQGLGPVERGAAAWPGARGVAAGSACAAPLNLHGSGICFLEVLQIFGSEGWFVVKAPSFCLGNSQ